MCGLTGIVNFHQSISNEDIFFLNNMLDEIKYRGPDGNNIYRSEKEALGFCRLSINDLYNGSQPFFNYEKTVVVMVNGEIYNHKYLKSKLKRKHSFRSTSDCEIVIHLYEEYGIECIKWLEGMFAISILDKVQNKLYLLKDPFGIKPLFYNINSERIIFGSEIKALMQYPDCPRSLDWNNALSDSWLAGHVSNNVTPVTSFFSEINNIEAGQYVEFNLQNKIVTQKKYWDITTISKHNLVGDDLTKEYIKILRHSTESCLMSDVDVGIFLSGGIDSVSIGYFASQKQSIDSFSVVSNSTILNGDAEFAFKATKEFGLKGHFAEFNEFNLDYSVDDWKALLWLCESPYCGAEQLYKYQLHKFAKYNNPNLKVILTGQGSDEFNGGYSKLFSGEDSSWSSFIHSLDILENNKLFNSLNDPINTWNQLFQGDLIKENFFNKENNDTYLSYVFSKYKDIQMYNCWLEDRIAAGNHIENRVPFLNHKLVELALGVKKENYSDFYFDKSVLRNGLAMHTNISNELINRPKVPFFYGDGVVSTKKMILNVIKKSNYELIDYAFDNNDLINKDAIYKFVKNLEQSSDLENIEFLSRIINLGVLDRMSKELDVKVKQTNEINIQPSVNPEKIAFKNSNDIELDLDVIIELNENVELLKSIRNKNIIYISINEVNEYIVDFHEDKFWYSFISDLDQKKTLKEILYDNDLVLDDIKENLIESLKLNIVNIKNKRIMTF